MTTATPAPLVFSPYDYAVHEDPYPFYARLRAEAPVYHNAELDFWALSKYSDVREAFRAPEVFSSAMGVSLDPAAYGPHAYKTMSFLAMDDPRHARLRRLVSKGFTSRRVDSLGQGIEKISRQYWDECLQRAGDGETIDFVDDYAGKLLMDVIPDLMGVPGRPGGMRRLATWSCTARRACRTSPGLDGRRARPDHLLPGWLPSAARSAPRTSPRR